MGLGLFSVETVRLAMNCAEVGGFDWDVARDEDELRNSDSFDNFKRFMKTIISLVATIVCPAH